MADTDDELPKIGAPATRALAAAGITSLSDVRRVSLDDLAALHGVGPKAIRILREALDGNLRKIDVTRAKGLKMPEMQPTAPDGEHTERYADGGVKAHGRRVNGELEGYWEWFRKDGSKMRSGHFDRGEQVGEWITYDRAGAPHKVTQKKGPAARD